MFRTATDRRAALTMLSSPRAVPMCAGAIIPEGPPVHAIPSGCLSELYSVPIHVARVALPGPGARSARMGMPAIHRVDPTRNGGSPCGRPV